MPDADGEVGLGDRGVARAAGYEADGIMRLAHGYGRTRWLEVAVAKTQFFRTPVGGEAESRADRCAGVREACVVVVLVSEVGRAHQGLRSGGHRRARGHHTLVILEPDAQPGGPKNVVSAVLGENADLLSLFIVK